MRWLVLILACLCSALSAEAEIYQWKDAAGQVHFTQDLNQVPSAYRTRAKADAKATGGPPGAQVQTFSSGSVASATAATRRLPGQPGEVHRIRVGQAGTSMLVNVRLNGSVTAPFLVDTGASDVLLPSSVARQLGLDTGPGVRTKRYSTANGVVEHPVVMLRSVNLGGATVKNVPASVSDSMSFGLLGLSFFNHFTYNIDAAAGVLTLERNALASTGQIRGGRSPAQWRSEYASLNARIGWVISERDEKTQSKTRILRGLEKELARLEAQLESLDVEADQANVPMAWRR